MNHPIPSISTNLIVFGALNVLLFATVGAAYLPLGNSHFLIAMALATVKAVLIVLYFMHVKDSHRLTATICVASFLWLGIMVVFTLTDYMARSPNGWLSIPGK